MDIDDLVASMDSAQPPNDLDPALKALWWARKGDWHEAHRVTQEADTREAYLVHAYLHRMEGDDGNARYWYHRAGAEFPIVSLEEEWCVLAGQFLLHAC